MNFLIDADCPRSVAVVIHEAGHKFLDIRDIKPDAGDDFIYDLVLKDGLILITRDTDFSNILRYPATANCGIIVLRVHLLNVFEIQHLLRYLLNEIPSHELFGSLTVVRKDRIRIHKF